MASMLVDAAMLRTCRFETWSCHSMVKMATYMEALQLLQVSPVQDPCLTTIEEAGENNRPVHLELRGLPDIVLLQDASLQAAKSLAGLADPGADLLVETPVTADHAAEVFEVIDCLQLGAIS